MNILSVQSWVAHGHVGNAAAVFPMQRLGAEVWAVNTVQFSNHTGYPDWTGTVCSGAEIAAIVAGVAARGVLASCDAVLSGYVGDIAVGEAILEAVGRVKAANPAALYCCDPVIGDDDRGIYVRAGVPAFIAQAAVPRADIVTPNQFELAHLTGRTIATLDEAKAAAAVLSAQGPRIVLVTSLRTAATPADAIDLLVADSGACHLLRTPLLPIIAKGAGDVIAGLFLFHCLAGRGAAAALEAAASAVFGLLRRTAEAGAPELLIVAAQEEFVAPSQRFSALPC
jgi:pyridoxine kinase